MLMTKLFTVKGNEDDPVGLYMMPKLSGDPQCSPPSYILAPV